MKKLASPMQLRLKSRTETEAMDVEVQSLVTFSLDRKRLLEFFGPHSHGFSVYPDPSRKTEVRFGTG